MVDAMFGATSSDFAQRNDLSAMEMRIGKQMIELTLAGFTEVLSSFAPLDWSIVQHETAVNMLAIADKQDWMISTTGIFETALGIGSIRAIVPYSAFEPFEARISAQTWLIGPALVDSRWSTSVGNLTHGTNCEIIFDIARLQLPLGLIRRLEQGKLIPIWLTNQATGHVLGLDILSADYGQRDGLVCCRPTAVTRSEIFLARAQRPLEKPKFPFFVPKAVEAAGAATEDETGALDRVLLDVTVRLGEVSMTVGELESLKVGQLITLDKNADTSFSVLVEGRPFGEGEIVSTGAGRYALRMIELYSEQKSWVV
jgi:flagellar motor switch protein FliM